MTNLLNRGDPFPKFSVNLVDGRRLAVPGDLHRERNVLLFYRGWW
jgi:peroxiredoxin